MPIELRILSGSRAGQSASFDKPVIAVGRHPMSDLRFDAKLDLDVSTRHGEIRAANGQYTIYDQQSTNGTFVNRERVPSGSSRQLRDGDVISFGAHGPTVKVSLPDQPGAVPSTPARRPTVERIAVAVHEQTRGLRYMVAGAVIVLGGLAAGIFWMGRRDAAARDREIARISAALDSASTNFASRMSGMTDTATTNSLRRMNDSLSHVAKDRRGTRASATAAQAELLKHSAMLSQVTDWAPAVFDANNAAIVLLTTVVGGQGQEGSGFSVGGGRIVTNRHVVADSTGRATLITVKFAETRNWRRAHLVKLAEGSDDLAIIQLDDAGPSPAVRGVASSVDSPVGSSIATIGFPLGTDLKMEGTGSDAKAAATMTIGTISKTTSDVLQIDAFATHGSSGSPVFDGHGHVIGVVYGGPSGGAGRIVYAVPADRLCALLGTCK